MSWWSRIKSYQSWSMTWLNPHAAASWRFSSLIFHFILIFSSKKKKKKKRNQRHIMSEWFYLMHCELGGPPSGRSSRLWPGREGRACVLACVSAPPCVCVRVWGGGDIVPWRHRLAQPSAALKQVFVIPRLPPETGRPQNPEHRRERGTDRLDNNMFTSLLLFMLIIEMFVSAIWHNN